MSISFKIEALSDRTSSSSCDKEGNLYAPFQGESLPYVKEQLGHSSIKLTVDVYGHLVPGANREAVNRLPSLSHQNDNSRTETAAK